MDNRSVDNATWSNWFVGASFDGTDHTQRFLGDGIWENGHDEKYHQDLVRAMQPGERIAIKVTYTRKNDLPFDNRGHSVSVMRIKATGTILENLNDGKRVRVNWREQDTAREWYFYTYRGTVWRVLSGKWKDDNLIAFSFEEKPQDITRFRNDSFWRERFGDHSDEQRFLWTRFYEAVAEKVLDYQSDRTALIEGIHEIGSRVKYLSYLNDKDSPDADSYPLKDIDPFTTIGTFNRSITDSNRRKIAVEIANLLGVDVDVPRSLEGVPRLNNQRSWFFGYSFGRGDGDIDALWDVFVAARQFADSDQSEYREKFTKAYETAIKIRGVGWNLSIGLYWAHPWDFPTLDGPSRSYIKGHLGMDVPDNSGEGYVKLIDDLKGRFTEGRCPVHSFPELSLLAGKDTQGHLYHESSPVHSLDVTDDDQASKAVQDSRPLENYSVNDIIKDGCFLEQEEIERLLRLLRIEKNLILQGPPGTGKSWIAKRLAFALMGEKDNNKLLAVQFHPNMSYEDFVRGWRPSPSDDGKGRFVIEDGVFMKAVHSAYRDSSSQFVIVIEEINRGNPAQIFGELLTLLEPDKRAWEEALELSYPDKDGKRRPVHVPENLYVVGTMNTADRSLALIDLAFRRRFAFADLEPKLGDRWREWVIEERGVDAELAHDVAARVTDLNQRIAEDSRLGSQFRIGHSFVTPVRRLEDGGTKNWFEQVVKSRIGPQLEEYWFDDPKTAKDAINRLLEGW